ncbi:unnamed protein product [marine sediment metagenome]|uniref:DNA methylase N-4/N-6 domain-containing protein n=1 Tax=marine sediment metagenome TaxID=412755 RepID=X1J9U7_9ZZZZ
MGWVEILPIDEQGIERCWRWGKETLTAKLDKYIEVKKTKRGFDLFIKERESDYEGEKPKTIWDKSKYTGQTATWELKKLFGDRVFSYPKSHFLIMDILKITTEKDDIVMDCFGGSGTTAHAVLELNNEDGGNRKFVICEQLDYVETVTRDRVCKVIALNKSSDFIYFELMKFNEAFIDRIQAAKASKELVVIWKELSKKSFLNWYVNPEAPEDAVKDFEEIGKK